MDNTFWILLAVFVMLDLALVTFVIVSKSRHVFSRAQKELFLRHWNNIRPMDPAHSVIEADKLLDKVLTARGYIGSLGDKLKKAGPAFTNINDVWSAHKLRNRIAHELGVKISDDEAKSALKKYERALRDLGLF
jgi:hypothetical protein